MRNSLLLSAVFAVILAPFAYAQAPQPETVAIDSEGSGAIADQPLQVMKSGDVTYITGGVGDEEKTQLMAQEKDYNFHLLMTAAGGAFVSEVHLQIAAKDGTPVLDISDAGPYVYVHLHPGVYMVSVTHRDEAKRVKFTVPAKGATRQQIEFKQGDAFTTVHAPTATVD